MIAWGSPGQGAMFGVITPFDGKQPTVGNGTMFGFAAEDRGAGPPASTTIALANGGSDEGPPGARGGGSSTAPISAIRTATSWSPSASRRSRQ